MKYKGMSLSFCIKDVIRGNKSEDEITIIHTATAAYDDYDWGRVLAHYCDVYWREAPDKARAIFWRLFDAGKIDQPRLRGMWTQGYLEHWWIDSYD